MNPLGRPRVAPAVRFWAKVEKTDTCWYWTGIVGKKGYGQFRPDPKQASNSAHIWAYIQVNGPIPAGMVLDHRCHDPMVCQLGPQCPHRRCVNPAHLILTTRSVNSSAARQSSNERRKTHCPQGHPYDEENTYWAPGGKNRQCRTCRRDHQRRFTAQRKEATCPIYAS